VSQKCADRCRYCNGIDTSQSVSNLKYVIIDLLRGIVEIIVMPLIFLAVGLFLEVRQNYTEKLLFFKIFDEYYHFCADYL
jgi:hypothetical protein